MVVIERNRKARSLSQLRRFEQSGQGDDITHLCEDLQVLCEQRRRQRTNDLVSGRPLGRDPVVDQDQRAIPGAGQPECSATWHRLSQQEGPELFGSRPDAHEMLVTVGALSN